MIKSKNIIKGALLAMKLRDLSQNDLITIFDIFEVRAQSYNTK